MKNSDAVKLASKIHVVTKQAASIEHKVWSFSNMEKRAEYKVIWFTTASDCNIETFGSWKELLNFCKEKWNV
jgi:hypothetical protein